MTYIAIAYRYGWSNGHWYIVHAGPNQRAIIDAAQAENTSRGGKYGVQVIAINENGDESQVVYFPSSYGESSPRMSIKTEVWERVGFAVLQAIKDGKPMSVEEIQAASDREEKIAKIMAGGTP